MGRPLEGSVLRAPGWQAGLGVISPGALETPKYLETPPKFHSQLSPLSPCLAIEGSRSIDSYCHAAARPVRLPSIHPPIPCPWA